MRRKSKIIRVKKTLMVLPKTAEQIERASDQTGEYESQIVDKAIAFWSEVHGIKASA